MKAPRFELRAFLKAARQHHSAVHGGATCLYAISCPGYVKIGIATDPKRRLMNLQGATPFKLTLEYAMVLNSRTAAVLAERSAHDMLKEFAAEGEWFALSGEDVWPLLDGICRHADLLVEVRNKHSTEGGDPSDHRFERTLYNRLYGVAPKRAAYAHLAGLTA